MIALNLLGFDPFSNSLSFCDLLCFGLGSFVLVSILSWYYNRIHKSNHSINDVERSIYQSKDILLQDYKVETEYAPIGQTTSVWVKTIVYILVLLVAITPLFELLGLEFRY
ncbi:hypothetical protein PG911_00870 [Tenacibaculum ovolyticum]|uniref:hypothetical protein n=1 Tax=Tenacibaculum ovolyticum TaxID=104270 RepID=UPI0022F3C25F|nr:hypothetical protein [Tenacibaculum ovolyticum]WBX76842.1 hypothetical protein PG911_00870 [Tenacibaculum ovolyticum]